MKLDIKSFGAGQIICDGLDAPINRFLLATFGAKSAATLTVNRFGNFTAYFKALPPPVPGSLLLH